MFDLFAVFGKLPDAIEIDLLNNFGHTEKSGSSRFTSEYVPRGQKPRDESAR